MNMVSRDHQHNHSHGSELSDVQLRMRAIETILTEKGYVDPAALDAIVEAFETKIGPRNGAWIVAKAWTDAEFKRRLIADATAAANSLGYVSRVGSDLIAVENTPRRHNVVVCTLCSCYPWEVLGLPPVWYKSAPYRSRVGRCDPGPHFRQPVSRETRNDPATDERDQREQRDEADAVAQRCAIGNAERAEMDEQIADQ
jgi:hypothetical protein